MIEGSSHSMEEREKKTMALRTLILSSIVPQPQRKQMVLVPLKLMKRWQKAEGQIRQ